METKKCGKCGEVKDVGEFYKNRSCCKKCRQSQLKEWQNNNRDKIKKYSRSQYVKNPEKLKERAKEWQLNNPEKYKERKKEWLLNNPGKDKESRNKWKCKNPEKVKENSKNQRKSLNTCYIKKTLKLSGFTTEQINENPELIEVKRLIIKTKRLCKTLPTSEKA